MNKIISYAAYPLGAATLLATFAGLSAIQEKLPIKHTPVHHRSNYDDPIITPVVVFPSMDAPIP